MLRYHRQARILGRNTSPRQRNSRVCAFSPPRSNLRASLLTNLLPRGHLPQISVKIFVVGGGAREHAFVWKLSQERTVTEIVCAPGNPGIASIARCIDADSGAPAEMLAIAIRERADLTVVGPELP